MPWMTRMDDPPVLADGYKCPGGAAILPADIEIYPL